MRAKNGFDVTAELHRRRRRFEDSCVVSSLPRVFVPAYATGPPTEGMGNEVRDLKTIRIERLRSPIRSDAGAERNPSTASTKLDTPDRGDQCTVRPRIGFDD